MKKRSKIPKGLRFRKSSYSQYTWNQCVEVATHKNLVFVRDSKNPDGPVLQFTPKEWLAFVEGVKNNEFNTF